MSVRPREVWVCVAAIDLQHQMNYGMRLDIRPKGPQDPVRRCSYG
jgi:hypothetical protein